MPEKKMSDHDLVSKGLPKKGEVKGQDDAIASDIQKAKIATGKMLHKFKAKVAPVLPQKTPGIQSISAPVKDIITKEFIKKTITITVTTLLFVFIVLVVSYIYRSVTGSRDGELSVLPTPSVGPFKPYNPSIYAEDEQVLQMEEDAKILDRELSTAQLKETALTPPSLDFNVNFKD